MVEKIIKDLREDHDYTQQRLADELKIDIKTYNRYEKGLHEIKLSILIKIARFYNISMDYLVGLTKEQKPIFEETKKALTQKELALIRAYNKNKNLQEAVDKLLDIGD